MGDMRRYTPSSTTGELTVRVVLTIGGTGAVASFISGGGAVLTAVRTSAGLYTLTLAKAYNQPLTGFKPGMYRPAGATLQPVLTAGDGTTTTLAVTTAIADGTATDPTSGDKVFLEFTFDEQGLVK